MAQTKKISELDLYILDTKNPKKSEVELVENVFQFWKTSWEDTLTQLEGGLKHPLPSNDFVDRKPITLFSKAEPVAAIFVNEFSLRPSQLHHSYFHSYPKSVLQDLKRIGVDDCMVLSYMTCKPEWRKKYTDLPISELLFSLGMKLLKNSNTPYMISSVRKDVGVTDIFSRHGASNILQGKMHNVDVNFMYVPKEKACLSPIPGVASVANELWNKMKSRSENLTENLGAVA